MTKVRLVASVAAALVAMNAVGPAAAATATCFQSADIEAEQAIRYQTEVMVISDTCSSDSYRDFTVHTRTAIIAYQNQLIDRFRRAGARSPRASLDSFLTEMANERALATGRERSDLVCQRSVALLAEAKTMSAEQFRHHIASLAAESGKGYRRCAG